ncbi:ty3-gypsy retrotransposon protein [Cucumis melo var. makuwa]|uniref:Ty3-gypsy retrotransposon protein n=1 Tax=Cucumis melo var. makuwa TaxID=1194695 RepID=A0A5D3B9V3_CUCMM|nr:ty3-gypsy retrotransposon protein [Cucumis melo var. makuwa]
MIDEHNSSSKCSNEKVSHPNIMLVMVTNVDRSEDRMTKLEKKVNMLMKAVEERDFKIASLKNHIESCDTAESSHIYTVKNVDKRKQLCKKEIRKEKKEVKSTQKVSKGATKEAMVVSSTPLKFVSKKKKVKKRHDEGEKRYPSLKERQEKVYPFPDSNLPDMLEKLIKKQLIQLPECKRPTEMGKVNDPNYCKYHEAVNRPIEKYFVLKEFILKLALVKNIELDLDEVAQTNHVAIINYSNNRLSATRSLIQFGLLEPVVIYSSPEALQNNDSQTVCSKEEEKQVEDANEGWTLEQKLNQILIDNGSVINIVPKSTMNKLVEERKDSEEGEKDRSQRSFILDHFTSSVARPSVFQRLSTLTTDDKNQGSTSSSTQLSVFQSLLKAYKDVFAWSCKEMPELDPKVAVHRLTIKPEHRPIKQTQQTHFSNRGRGATYICAMQRIFDDVLHKHVAYYVNDLVVKSKKKCDHLKDLKLVIDRLRKYQLRMNPLKCTFDVTSGKFMGFVVRHRGIEVDHSKIDAI